MENEKDTLKALQKQGQKYGRKKRIRKAALIGLAVVFLISAGAAAFLYFSAAKVQGEFKELSAIVQENRGKAESQDTDKPAPPESAEEPAAEEETEPQMLPQYAAVYEQNPDLFGWLRIEGTVIDYPVMHTPEDPEKYLHANFSGAYSYEGVPFIDANCAADSDNLIIYAHNMLNGTMFRDIMKYENEAYWKEHPTICFDTLYEEQEYEVLAAFYDRVYLKTDTCFKFYKFIDAADEADFAYAMENYREKAIYDTGVEASYGDKLITLVTCAYHVENGRFVVVARKK